MGQSVILKQVHLLLNYGFLPCCALGANQQKRLSQAPLALLAANQYIFAMLAGNHLSE
jgi:hypothetical protein